MRDFEGRLTIADLHAAGLARVAACTWPLCVATLEDRASRAIRSRCALDPTWVLSRHPVDQLAEFLRNRWPPGSRLPSPPQPKARSMPANQRCWLDDHQRRQSKHRDRSVSITRVAASTRLGFTPRSRYSASWRRRNRISASSDSRGRNRSPHHWIRSQARRTMMENALSTPGSCHSYRSWPAPRTRSNFCGPQVAILS